MRHVPRLPLAACALVFAAVAVPSRADLVFLKDGHVLQGNVRREVNAELDPVSREMVLIPKGFFSVDDGPRRVYFAPSRVRIVEKLASPTEERILSRSGRMIVNPRPLPPHLEVVEEGKWNLEKWEREYAFRSPGYSRVGTIQGLATLSPYYARVDAVTKFRWSAAYLTREWDPATVIALLKANPALAGTAKDTPPQTVARRFRVCDFLAQAGWYDHAEKEIDAILRDFPDQKERVGSARAMLDKLRGRDEWEQVKNWYQAGRYNTVRRRLADFPTKNVGDRVLADIREMKAKLATSAEFLRDATQALDDVMKETSTPAGRSLAAAGTVIRNELHAATVDRLDAFLGQYRDAQRQKAREKKPSMDPDQLLSLAVTGWLLGSPSAEAHPAAAINLWKTRQMVFDYLHEPDATPRKRILDAYLASVTPRVDFDEIAQMIDHLPPTEPAKDLSTQVVECQAGNGRTPSTYHLKLPPEYTHNRQYPVLLVLPDGGMKATAMLDRFEKYAADHGYILAAPTWARGLATDYGYSEREHDTVVDTLRDLRRRFQVDSDRVFLFGLGEGGKMAFDVGLAHPDLFAGVLPMAAGPSLFPRRYWRNAQYLPFYVVNGTRGADSWPLLRDQFDHWITRAYPALWVEYKGRGTEFFSGELPLMFDWMRHQRRAFPLRQLGTDGNGTAFGNEFCTMRPEDNRFYWLSTSHISPRNLVSADRWNNAASPAAMTGRIDPDTGEIVVKTQGINEVTVWFGRNPAGQYMLDFDKSVTIRVGFRAMVINRKVKPDLEVLLQDLHQRGDRKHLFVAKIAMNLR